MAKEDLKVSVTSDVSFEEACRGLDGMTTVEAVIVLFTEVVELRKRIDQLESGGRRYG